MGTLKDKNGWDLVDAEEVKKRWKDIRQKNYIKKNPNELVIALGWLVTQSQTLWSAKSNGP